MNYSWSLFFLAHQRNWFLWLVRRGKPNISLRKNIKASENWVSWLYMGDMISSFHLPVEQNYHPASRHCTLGHIPLHYFSFVTTLRILLSPKETRIIAPPWMSVFLWHTKMNSLTANNMWSPIFKLQLSNGFIRPYSTKYYMLGIYFFFLKLLTKNADNCSLCGNLTYFTAACKIQEETVLLNLKTRCLDSS